VFTQRLRHTLKHVGFNALSINASPITSRRELDAFFTRVHPIKTAADLIRIGGDNDGGYLLPDDLNGVKTCFSPGVSDVADFELDLARRGIRCFLADYSVASAPISHPLIEFKKKFLGLKDNEKFLTLRTWVREDADASDGDLLLQMDIEGDEYAVILDTPNETLERFRIMVIEFHMLDDILHPAAYKLISAAFDKVLELFDVVHIHPNNDCIPTRYANYEIPPHVEMTLLRKDRVKDAVHTTQFPHPLDRPNVLKRPNIVLHRCWYSDAAC
jgi:hypothetical protein